MKRGTGSVTLQTEDTPPFRMTSLLSYAPVVQCTRDANVVLLLGHFCRNADAHLVKPLIAAAVTLDPIHLQKHTSQSTSQLNNRSTLPKAICATMFTNTTCVFMESSKTIYKLDQTRYHLCHQWKKSNKDLELVCSRIFIEKFS